MKYPPGLDKLLSEYKRHRAKIRRRLKEFSCIRRASPSRIFEELCFCLLTPQAKAVSCDAAIKDLKRSGLLLRGPHGPVSSILKGRVRFHNNKASYIMLARKLLKGRICCDLNNNPSFNRRFLFREWLVKNVKGMGYKEASHFLRNIGLGKDMAILDRHILKNLKTYGVINSIPGSMTARSYIDIEEKAKAFSDRIKIPLEELDLLLWSAETGFIFK